MAKAGARGKTHARTLLLCGGYLGHLPSGQSVEQGGLARGIKTPARQWGVGFACVCEGRKRFGKWGGGARRGRGRCARALPPAQQGLHRCAEVRGAAPSPGWGHAQKEDGAVLLEEAQPGEKAGVGARGSKRQAKGVRHEKKCMA